jgi:hypothetical protein
MAGVRRRVGRSESTGFYVRSGPRWLWSLGGSVDARFPEIVAADGEKNLATNLLEITRNLFTWVRPGSIALQLI